LVQRFFRFEGGGFSFFFFGTNERSNNGFTRGDCSCRGGRGSRGNGVGRILAAVLLLLRSQSENLLLLRGSGIHLGYLLLLHLPHPFPSPSSTLFTPFIFLPSAIHNWTSASTKLKKMIVAVESERDRTGGGDVRE